MQDLSGLQKVILYIEENYKQGVDIKEIEEISLYSYRNIQKVFKKIFKETILSFQKRLKFERAYEEEMHQKSILYSESAFQKPVQLFMPERRVFFKGIKTDYSNNEIDKLWDTMDVPVQNTKQAYYGLILDQAFINTNAKYRFEACVYAPSANSDLDQKNLFGQKYLKYTFQGDYDKLDDYYRLMYQDFLFQRNFQLDNSPIIEHYEMNDMNCTKKDDFVTHVYVPIKQMTNRLKN